ncbi:hypothetical protein Z043_102433 [Scleropages formosus]|uniref:IMD domain-containing protein n=1 Tax=Scleropages formosus TaxID=113540 RepID=A0A0P7VVE2_SCLFO|nr:hypothetical protein Z043_102433 [Scleropages formosus]
MESCAGGAGCDVGACCAEMCKTPLLLRFAAGGYVAESGRRSERAGWGRLHGDEGGRNTIMEQFNPCLRNFVAMGKNYEKALSSVTFAAKGYFDALVRMGELASESQGSKDLGESRFRPPDIAERDSAGSWLWSEMISIVEFPLLHI